MRSNRPIIYPTVETHEGGPAVRVSTYKELRRSALSSLLFEDLFYEKGSVHAERVAKLVESCKPEEVAALAIECREHMYLRHMPLYLVRELARHKGNGGIVADTLERVIQRPDELSEYLALYWREGKQPISAGSKRGLARAFKKFDAANLAKYDQDNAIKLRDVMRLVHVKPENRERSEVYRLLVKRELPAPDTWEVALSAGGDKKEVFERLLRERKLGGLAFLRNLRNMIGAKVDDDLIRGRFKGGFKYVLPFRFVSALRYAPQYVREMDEAMQRNLGDIPKLKGTTAILVDVSGSMDKQLSAKSEMMRIDAAGGLAILVSAVAERPRVFTFSTRLTEVPPYAGLALIRAIHDSQPHMSTRLGAAVEALNAQPIDRLIVISDEQSEDRVPSPQMKGYMINVNTDKHGVGYGPWVHVDGWSERILDFVREYEAD